MSEQDKSLLDEQALLIRAVYRALPEEEIPAEIEQRIIENAAAAIKPSSARRWLQWSAPLASAAVVLLVVAVVMQPQSQREMVPEPAVMVDLQQAPLPAAPAAPLEMADASAPRMMAEKPDLSASPKALEDIRGRAGEPRALADRAPRSSVPAAALAKAAPQMLKREESVSQAFQPPPVTAEERKEQEEDLPLTRAPAPKTSGTSSAAGASISANNNRAVADESRRSGFLRSAPAAAFPTAVSPVNPALDISPELRGRLEKLLAARQKINASAGGPSLDPTVEQLRRDYPGVDIDAALQALEQARVEGAE